MKSTRDAYVEQCVAFLLKLQKKSWCGACKLHRTLIIGRLSTPLERIDASHLPVRHASWPRRRMASRPLSFLGGPGRPTSSQKVVHRKRIQVRIGPAMFEHPIPP